MAEGVGNAPTSARADPVFETGAASLYLPAFQKWSGWQELHLQPPRSEQGRLLLTLHPEKWLPGLDSHQDKRLNRPPCYFDTTWQWLAELPPVRRRTTLAAREDWRCRQDSHLHGSA